MNACPAQIARAECSRWRPRIGRNRDFGQLIERSRVRGSLGTATLDYGQLISATTTRRIACDCKLIPVVLGGDGEPLDVGRAQRSVPLGIRRTLIARDRGCAFPGCDRPPGLCEAHHIIHWAEDGVTSVANKTPC